jgi:hypothetical protein
MSFEIDGVMTIPTLSDNCESNWLVRSIKRSGLVSVSSSSNRSLMRAASERESLVELITLST